MNEAGFGPKKVKPRFTPKSPEELRDQLSYVQEEAIGDSPELSLVPKSISKEEILAMPLEELKKRFAVRYDLYLKMYKGLIWLKRHQSEEGEEEVVIPPNIQASLEEIARLKRWLIGLNALDDYIQAHKEGGEGTLKDRQFTVFEDIRDQLEKGVKEGYIVLPTGVGKTVVFVELAEAFNSKTVVVVPTMDLITQTRKEFTKFAPGLTVGAVYTDEKDVSKQVILTTYQSLENLIDKHRINPGDIDLLILDEAHRGLSEKRSGEIREFKTAFTLGVTATPEFAEDKKLSDLLPNEIHRMPIREGIELGLLSNTMAAVVRTNIDLSEVPIEGGAYDQQKLEQKYNNKGLTKATIELYLERHNGKRAIAFCCGVQHAKDMAQAFLAAGVPAAAVYGDMKTTDRETLYEKMRTGELKVLTNAKLLTEGMNIREASVCFNIRPSSSVVEETQRSGRITRLDDGDPEKMAIVYDFVPKFDRRMPVVLFSSILGGTVVLQKKAFRGIWKHGEAPPMPDPIDIPGVEVKYEVEEVIKITQEYAEGGKKVTPEEIRAAIASRGETAKDWINYGKKERREIEIQGLKLTAIATLFGLQGNPLNNTNDFLDLCRAIFGSEQVPEFEEVTKDTVRRTLANQGVTAKEWISLNGSERQEIEIQGLKITALANLFGIPGYPHSNAKDFRSLCRAIFGSEQVPEFEEVTKDTVRRTLANQGVTAKEWVTMKRKQRDEIEIQGLKVTALATLFGLSSHSITNDKDFHSLCRAIFGSEQVPEFEEVTKDTVRRTFANQGITVKDWIGLTGDEREQIEIQGLKIHALATLFGIPGNPGRNSKDFHSLCRAIFGSEQVDQALKELDKGFLIRRTLTERGVTAKDWLSKDIEGREGIEVNGLKLFSIGKAFGITGHPVGSSVALIALCRAIFGSEEVDEALVKIREGRQQSIQQELRKKGVRAKDWVLMESEERKKINVNGLKVQAITTLFDVKGNSIGNSKVFQSLCRSIFGTKEVDKALHELKR